MRALALVLVLVACARPKTPPPPPPARWVMPIAFEPNLGQAPAEASFVAHRGSAVMLLSSRGATLASRTRRLELQVIGAAAVSGAGEARLPGVAHYYLGDDPSRWRTNLPTFGRVVFPGVYAGVDLVFHGERGALEYDFVVAPGADADLIRARLSGDGPIAFNDPSLYEQDLRSIEGGYRWHPDGAFSFLKQAGLHCGCEP